MDGLTLALCLSFLAVLYFCILCFRAVVRFQERLSVLEDSYGHQSKLVGQLFGALGKSSVDFDPAEEADVTKGV